MKKALKGIGARIPISLIYAVSDFEGVRHVAAGEKLAMSSCLLERSGSSSQTLVSIICAQGLSRELLY